MSRPNTRTARSSGDRRLGRRRVHGRHDGTTRNIKIADASHENYFRKEAVAAVEKWRFEPRVFMDRDRAALLHAHSLRRIGAARPDSGRRSRRLAMIYIT